MQIVNAVGPKRNRDRPGRGDFGVFSKERERRMRDDDFIARIDEGKENDL